MFLDELKPIFQEMLQQPVAFMGGFFSGIFRLKLTEEPLSGWLEKQGVFSADNLEALRNENRSKGPQSISIE